MFGDDLRPGFPQPMSFYDQFMFDPKQKRVYFIVDKELSIIVALFNFKL